MVWVLFIFPDFNSTNVVWVLFIFPDFNSTPLMVSFKSLSSILTKGIHYFCNICKIVKYRVKSGALP